MDTHRPPQSAATIEAGLEALAQGAWEEACSAFEGSLQADESPEALEGLGMAAWWPEDDRADIDARRRAYRLVLSLSGGVVGRWRREGCTARRRGHRVPDPMRCVPHIKYCVWGIRRARPYSII